MFPCVEPLFMPIFPDQFEGITANCLCRFQVVFARMGVRLRDGRIVMKQDSLALAPRTRTGIPQERKGRRTDVAIVPLKLEST